MKHGWVLIFSGQTYLDGKWFVVLDGGRRGLLGEFVVRHDVEVELGILEGSDE